MIGTAILAAAFFLMLTVTVDTSYALLDVYFLMIGIGLGLCMQTMLIAVQNTVPAKDMGVATSSATFFRQLGGTLGCGGLPVAAVQLPAGQGSGRAAVGRRPPRSSSRRSPRPPPIRAAPATGWRRAWWPPRRATPAAASSIGDALSTDSSFLNTLDPNIARPFQVGYVDSTHLVYIIGGIIMVLAFVLVMAMKELPLRTKSALDERLQEQADSERRALADERTVDAGATAPRGRDRRRPMPADTVARPDRCGRAARSRQRQAATPRPMVGSGGAHAATATAGRCSQRASRAATAESRQRGGVRHRA